MSIDGVAVVGFCVYIDLHWVRAVLGILRNLGVRLSCRLKWTSGVVTYGVALLSYRLEVVVELS